MSEVIGVPTHCPYCALQCAQSAVAAPAERPPVRVDARMFPTNLGGMCQKGWTSPQVLDVPDRLVEPQIRRNGRLQTVGWPEALDLVADRIRELQVQSGPDTVAVFGGGGLTNEKAYALGKFARVALRTRYIDYNGRFCMSSAAAAANRAFGMDRGLPFPVTDLAGADAVLLLGSNVATTMPPFVQHLRGVRDRGGLIVVDPRRSATARLADDEQGLHLQAVPGSDLAVLLALLRVLIDEDLIDHRYLDERTTGWADVRRSVAHWWPERAETVSGLPAASLRAAARRLAAASPHRGGAGAYILTGRGLEQSTQGTAGVTAAINLALALGLPGRAGSGFGALTGQGNGQGGREHGQKSDQLPGYSSIIDPARRAHVAGVWGVHPDSLPGAGVPAMELLQRMGTPGGPRALLLCGSNPVVSAPNADRVRAALGRLDLLVVADFMPSETVAMADVVLPVTQWAEEDGTMTNLEGRVIRRRRVVDPAGAARSELWILRELARRLGCAATFAEAPAEVFAELALASRGGIADYSGLSYARLDEEAEIHWPCPADGHSGTPRPFLDRFATPDGRARMIVVHHHAPAADVSAAEPVHLITGRVLTQYQSGAQTRRVPELNAASPAPFVEMHPTLARALAVAEGEAVRVTSARGVVVLPATITDAVRPDTVFVPFHWPASANVLTNDDTDPVSGMPDFKVCAVRVEKLEVA